MVQVYERSEDQKTRGEVVVKYITRQPGSGNEQGDAADDKDCEIGERAPCLALGHGFRLGDGEGYQIRLPIYPDVELMEYADYDAKVECFHEGENGCRVRVEISLPAHSVSQITVDPDRVLLDSDPTNNQWKATPRLRLTPLYTAIEETDVTNSFHCLNIIAGPWLFIETYNDPWYERSQMAGFRLGLYRTQDFDVEAKAATGGKGVDVVLDMVGGDYVPREIDCLAPDGRLVFIAVLGGWKTELNITHVMLKRLTITGSTLRPRPVSFKGAIAKSLREKIWPLIEAKKIKPVVYKTFALAEAAEAHRLMESSQHIGKIMLTI